LKIKENIEATREGRGNIKRTYKERSNETLHTTGNYANGSKARKTLQRMEIDVMWSTA
jgi:hypothetical protein